MPSNRDERFTRRDYDPSFHRNHDETYDRSHYRRDDSRLFNSRTGLSQMGYSPYGVGDEDPTPYESLERDSWYPGNHASYSPRDSRDNLDRHLPNYAGRGPKGYKRSDDRIKEEVSEILESHPRIDASEIEVGVKDGIVSLQGTVPDRRTKRMAEDAIHFLRGVKDVRNELTIDQSFWERAKEAIFHS